MKRSSIFFIPRFLLPAKMQYYCIVDDLIHIKGAMTRHLIIRIVTCVIIIK